MAHVKLILLEDIENLGLAGEEVSVAPGFARNYLLPRKLAAKATPNVLKILAARREQIEARRQAELAEAQALAAKLAELELTIPMQAAADEQLFGSVTPRMISEKLAENGFNVEHSRIRTEAIKTLGSFVAEVKLHTDVKADVKIWVVRA